MAKLRVLTNRAQRIVQYDPERRRLWVRGQRLHHGATGSLVAAMACAGLAAERHPSLPLAGMIAAGGLLMAHDWKDHSIWFERGYGSQP